MGRQAKHSSANRSIFTFTVTFPGTILHIGNPATMRHRIWYQSIFSGMCALFSTSVLVLTWWPLLRDCTFYSTSLITLVLFFTDQQITWYESAILLGIYGAYVVFMRWMAEEINNQNYNFVLHVIKRFITYLWWSKKGYRNRTATFQRIFWNIKNFSRVLSSVSSVVKWIAKISRFVFKE